MTAARRAYAASLGNPHVVAVVTAAGIAGGLAAWLAGDSALASRAWALVTLLALVPLTVSVAGDWRLPTYATCGGCSGLHAVLRLHFAQEEESYLSLFEAEAEAQPSAPGVPVCRAR